MLRLGLARYKKIIELPQREDVCNTHIGRESKNNPRP